MKLRVGDEVKVMVGKDRGKTGKIEKILPKENTVIAPGINMYKRHHKPRKQGEKGGIIDIVKPINVAKVSLICPKCQSVTRVGFKFTDGKKTRICHKCQQEI